MTILVTRVRSTLWHDSFVESRHRDAIVWGTAEGVKFDPRVPSPRRVTAFGPQKLAIHYQPQARNLD